MGASLSLCNKPFGLENDTTIPTHVQRGALPTVGQSSYTAPLPPPGTHQGGKTFHYPKNSQRKRRRGYCHQQDDEEEEEEEDTQKTLGDFITARDQFVSENSAECSGTVHASG